MELPSILQDITNLRGWLSGSYVRDVLVRKDTSYSVRDIDVLIPFSLHKMLVSILTRKYNLREEPLDDNPDDQIAHTHLHYGEIIIDIFSSEGYEYLSPLDFDVNALCWTGEGLTIWYPVREEEEKLYGYLLDDESIIERALKKEAIAMIGEWSDKEEMSERFDKLLLKDWTILNYQETEESLSS